MQNKILKQENLNAFLDHLAKNYNLTAPVEEDGITDFKPVSSSVEINLNFANSVVAPKKYFLPASEKMFSFTGTGEINPVEPKQDKKSVLFGVRSCDIRSLLLLDPVFNGAYPDSYYREKRENTLIIGLSCEVILPTCFCRSFGISPTGGEGADLLFTRLGSYYLVEILTPAGEELINTLPVFEEQGAAEAFSQKQSLTDRLEEQFFRRPDLTGVKEILDDMFEHPYWEKLAAKCISCGICTFICPTCHCFTIIDTTGADKAGDRYRCQDSCMFPGFTQMAGGHNPRPTKTERVRNRYMHKLKYHLDRYNLEGCVGCGRCIAKCPVNMDISQIITEIKEVGRNG